MQLELNLKDGDAAVQKLLTFLRFSFGGGTDVDRPLELSLAKLQQDEWKQACLGLTMQLASTSAFLSCNSEGSLQDIWPI